MNLKRRFNSVRLEENFDFKEKDGQLYAVLKAGKKSIEFTCCQKFTLGAPESLEELSNEQLKKVLDVLEKSLCLTKEEELGELISICKNGCPDEKKYVRQIPSSLKKLAQKKYREIFYSMVSSY